MAKGDIRSLPVWAQQHVARLVQNIERLEVNLASANATLSAGPEDSDTFADPYSEGGARPLGRGTRLRLHSTEVYFDVHIDDEGVLHVSAAGKLARSDGLAVYPHSSNSVRIRGGRL
jgi:hypothetical protein